MLGHSATSRWDAVKDVKLWRQLRRPIFQTAAYVGARVLVERSEIRAFATVRKMTDVVHVAGLVIAAGHVAAAAVAFAFAEAVN